MVENDRQVEITLSALLDIIDGGSPEERQILAQKLAPNFILGYEQRTANMEDVRQNFWPRVTVNDADVTANESGTEVWGGQSRFAVLDFPNATAWIDTNDGNTAHIRGAGGGADCMFDILVSGCFATLTGWTSGQVFTSLSGCTFVTFATVQAAVTWIGTSANVTDGDELVMYICSGTYTENVVV